MAELTLAEIGEDAMVRRLVENLPQGRDVIAGPGDDCAVVEIPKNKNWLGLLKTDCLVEHVHFSPETEPARIGWKAMARAISDVAACGGEPLHALVTIAAPSKTPFSKIQGIYSGLLRASAAFDISIVGGETSRTPSDIVLSIALHGRVRRKRLTLRSGGRPGDVLFVTGKLGGSIQGKHLDFLPRIEESSWLTKNFDIRAMMDLSDGLGTDLPRLADASHTGYDLALNAIPLSDGMELENAISDGEDYELLFTVNADDAISLAARWIKRFPEVPLSRIGYLTKDITSRTPMVPGFSHFPACISSSTGT